MAALVAPNALIGGDAPADVHPLGGREDQWQGTKAQRHEGTKCDRISLRASVPSSLRAFRRGFTLIEILIVIGIIVLLVALAVPAFNAISGSRSIDGAANTISAFVGRARLEAIGLQETRGVMFFIDPVSQETKMAIVRAAARPAGVGGVLRDPSVQSVDLYLDLASDKDLLTLPAGVGLQVVDDCAFNTATKQRTDDGFLGFNNNYYYGVDDTNTTQKGTVPLQVQYGGVILFDAQGKLLVTSYAFKTRDVDEVNAVFFPTLMGKRLFTTTNSDAELRTARSTIINVANVVPWQTQVVPTGSGQRPVRSQVGFVLYDKSSFEAKQYTLDDPQLADRVYQSDTIEFGTNNDGEEHWLDENATVYLVNRYNGTLVKGE